MNTGIQESGTIAIPNINGIGEVITDAMKQTPITRRHWITEHASSWCSIGAMAKKGTSDLLMHVHNVNRRRQLNICRDTNTLPQSGVAQNIGACAYKSLAASHCCYSNLLHCMHCTVPVLVGMSSECQVIPMIMSV